MAKKNPHLKPEYWERRALVYEAGVRNDTSFLAGIGSMEAYTWHEGRKSMDPNHCNPYIMKDLQRAYNTSSKGQQMLKVSFTFCANRESSPQQALELFKHHFPGAFGLGYASRLDNFYRVTCSSEEFVRWVYARDQMGFTNRMHQLNMRIENVPQHYPRQEAYTYKQRVGLLENPIKYETPTVTGVA
jgi:hypothetical protein